MPTYPRFVTWIVSLTVVLCIPVSLWSQTASSGEISGTVLDQSKAAIPGAAVTVTEIATGRVRAVSTNGDGAYSVTLLEPGRYSVTVAAAGVHDPQG